MSKQTNYVTRSKKKIILGDASEKKKYIKRRRSYKNQENMQLYMLQTIEREKKTITKTR